MNVGIRFIVALSVKNIKYLNILNPLNNKENILLYLTCVHINFKLLE